MARQAKKENTENMDATVPDQPDVETIASENTAENIVPQPEQNANTEEGKDEGRIESPETGDEDKAQKNEPGPEAKRPQAPLLESIAILSNRHRIPGWQQAALMRMMGWDDGKAVSDEEYRDALDRLRSRRLGGGRLA